LGCSRQRGGKGEVRNTIRTLEVGFTDVTWRGTYISREEGTSTHKKRRSARGGGERIFL